MCISSGTAFSPTLEYTRCHTGRGTPRPSEDRRCSNSPGCGVESGRALTPSSSEPRDRLVRFIISWGGRVGGRRRPVNGQAWQ